MAVGARTLLSDVSQVCHALILINVDVAVLLHHPRFPNQESKFRSLESGLLCLNETIPAWNQPGSTEHQDCFCA